MPDCQFKLQYLHLSLLLSGYTFTLLNKG